MLRIGKDLNCFGGNISWTLHHDDAHVSLVTNNLTKYRPSIVPHPLFSLYLVPTNFFLFNKLKTMLKGCRFQFIDGI
ncbi:hypothetical protein X975_18100, partial [Stegodyphus mimosarum]